MDVSTRTVYSAQRLHVIEKLLRDETHVQSWCDTAPYDVSRPRTWRNKHKRAYLWMAREYGKRMQRTLPAAPVWVSFDYEKINQMQLIYGREAIERVLTLEVPTHELFRSMHGPWISHILEGYCLDDQVTGLPYRWDESGMRFCISCEHTGARRRASWEAVFNLSADPLDWQGVLDRIEPCWLRAIDGDELRQ